MGQGNGPASRVVVVGASLAGLFAAAAAAGFGRSVTVLERDVLPAGATSRPGVPQGQQPHVFLYRGLLAVEQLLPGLRRDLLAAGAVPLDTGDLPWLGEFGWIPVGRPVFEILSATRPLFEDVVRRRVCTLPGVELRDGVRVTGVERLRGGWSVRSAGGSTYEADVLVDASGRSSRLPAWLATLGVSVPPSTEVNARVGYATRLYAGPPALLDAPGAVVAATPQTLMGGLALRVEGGRWVVGAVGFGDKRPPRDPDGFANFLAGLADPILADIADHCEPLTGVLVHRQTGNMWHHYERVRQWPEGLLVVGDALCAFDPVYGQGITVAACEAVLLRQALADGFPTGSGRQLMRRFGATVRLPWAIATGEDLRFPTSAGSQNVAQAAFGWWARELGRRSVHGDWRARDALGRVYHLMGSPASLVHPALVVGVARGRLLGLGPPAPRPRGLDIRAVRAP